MIALRPITPTFRASDALSQREFALLRAQSIARHLRFLWAEERAAFAPSSSEDAIRAITNRIGAKAPEFNA